MLGKNKALRAVTQMGDIRRLTHPVISNTKLAWPGSGSAWGPGRNNRMGTQLSAEKDCDLACAPRPLLFRLIAVPLVTTVGRQCRPESSQHVRCCAATSKLESNNISSARATNSIYRSTVRSWSMARGRESTSSYQYSNDTVICEPIANLGIYQEKRNSTLLDITRPRIFHF